ncbi:MAG: DUF3850 domain-containing protein [Lactococcus lactis]
MNIHKKKLDFQFFEDIKSGKKRFEVRLNECDYQVGDVIELKAYKAECYVKKDLKAYVGEASPLTGGWIYCKESKAEIIRVEIVSVMDAKLYNCDEIKDDILVMYGSYDLRDVKKVLSNYFKVDKLPKDYVVLEIKVI